MSRRIERRAELLVELEQAVAGLTPVPLVTDNPRKLDTAPLAPGLVVLLPMPGLEFPVPGVTAVEWTVLVAGRPDPIDETWSRLDDLIDALRDAGQHVTEANPDAFPRDGEDVALPGYVLTITEQLYD